MQTNLHFPSVDRGLRSTQQPPMLLSLALTAHTAALQRIHSSCHQTPRSAIRAAFARCQSAAGITQGCGGSWLLRPRREQSSPGGSALEEALGINSGTHKSSVIPPRSPPLLMQALKKKAISISQQISCWKKAPAGFNVGKGGSGGTRSWGDERPPGLGDGRVNTHTWLWSLFSQDQGPSQRVMWP